MAWTYCSSNSKKEIYPVESDNRHKCQNTLEKNNVVFAAMNAKENLPLNLYSLYRCLPENIKQSQI